MKFIPIVVVLALLASGCGATATADISSCQQAIEKARTMAGVAGDAFGVAAKYPPMIGRAAEAGALSDVAEMKRIARSMNRHTATLEAQAEQISVLVDEFNEAAELCE